MKSNTRINKHRIKASVVAAFLCLLSARPVISQPEIPPTANPSTLTNTAGESSSCSVESESDLKSALATMKSKSGQKFAVLCVEILNGNLNLVLFTESGKAPLQKQKMRSVSLEELRSAMEELKQEVADRRKIDREDYLKPAKQLYQWLIAPIESELKQQQIQTLMFAVKFPASPAPLEVLFDEVNEKYLIEKYSISRILNLSDIIRYSQTLDKADYGDFENANALVMGMEVSSTPNSQNLPGIKNELIEVGGNWGLSTSNKHLEPIVDEDFTRSRLQEELRNKQYQFIYVATHGFRNVKDADRYYLKLWDGEIAFEDLKELFKSQESELLILSACNTASGSEDGQLRIQDLVSQTQIKTILASQYHANNIAAYITMVQFSDNFTDPLIFSKIRGFRKAQALQQVQKDMLNRKIYLTKDGKRAISVGDGFEPALRDLPTELADAVKNSPEMQNREGDKIFLDHPYFWAAFTLIGSPI